MKVGFTFNNSLTVVLIRYYNLQNGAKSQLLSRYDSFNPSLSIKIKATPSPMSSPGPFLQGLQHCNTMLIRPQMIYMIPPGLQN